MRQKEGSNQRSKEAKEQRRERRWIDAGDPEYLLRAAEDEAGDVVGLAGGADEVFDAFHEELQSLLGVKNGHAADDVEPASIGKFLTFGIEGFDDAIGKENESVAWLERYFGRREIGFVGDAQGKAEIGRAHV